MNINKQLNLCPVLGCRNILRGPECTNALSRKDNKTYICSDCGTREALEAYFNSIKK